MTVIVPSYVQFIDERGDLGRLLESLGPTWRVRPGRPREGAPVEGVVVLALATGTTPTAARSRAAGTARRHGWPVIVLADGLPLPGRDLEPGVDVLPVAGLNVTALARALRHARARSEAVPLAAPCAATVIGLAVDAALHTATEHLAEAVATASDLRRHALGDPRAARHAEAIAWGLRETGAAISAALAVDLDPDLPIPTHTLMTVAEPLLKAALGTGTRLATDDAMAPIRLVPGTVVDVLVHLAADCVPLIPSEGGRPAMRFAVSGTEHHLDITIRLVDAATGMTAPSAATRLALERCQGEVTVVDGVIALRVPLLDTDAPHEGDPRVLLVDDHAEVAAAIGATLGDAGIGTITASTAEQALEQLARHPALRVVVSDLALPGMDGLALAQRLRAVGCTARFVLITGLADERTEAALSEGLFTAALDKPFSPPALVAVVRAALGAD